MELTWLSSSLWWLIPLVGLPLIAHLVRRPPKEKWFFGAMYLLEQVKQKNTTRNRVDDWWLLLLRLLLLLLLGLAILRPEIRWDDPNEQLEYSKRVVILVDRSLSMNQTLSPTSDRTVLEWSKKTLTERLKEDQEQRTFQMATFDSTVEEVFADWQGDQVALLTGVERINQGQQRTNVVEAIRWARQKLDGQGGEIWLYTDQAGAVSEALKSEISLLVEQNVALIPYTPTIEEPSNLTIVEAEYGAGLEGGTLKFTVQNFGDRTRESKCTTTLPDGTEIHTIVEVPAQGQTESFVTIPRVSDGGIGKIEVLDDRLTLDNEWYFQLPQIGANRVVLVDGDPGSAPIDSEVYFLERALSPSSFGASIVPEVVGDLSAVEPDVNKQAVIVLANVGDLGGALGSLVEYVRSGGGLFIALGGNTNLSAVNQGWSAILPAALKDRHTLSSEYEYGTPLALPNLDRELFAPFQSGGAGGFSKVRWLEVYLFSDALSENVEVLLALDNGLPVLVEYPLGKGTVCLLLGSLDMEYSNFPLQSVYMPFMQKLIAHLGGHAQGGERIEATLGDSVSIEVPNGIDSLQWTSDNGVTQALLSNQRVRLDAERSGAYVLQAGTGTVFAWASVNTDRLESNIAVTEPLLEVAAEVAPEAFQERRDVSPWLILSALVLLMVQAIWPPNNDEVVYETA